MCLHATEDCRRETKTADWCDLEHQLWSKLQNSQDSKPHATRTGALLSPAHIQTGEFNHMAGQQDTHQSPSTSFQVNTSASSEPLSRSKGMIFLHGAEEIIRNRCRRTHVPLPFRADLLYRLDGRHGCCPVRHWQLARQSCLCVTATIGP